MDGKIFLISLNLKEYIIPFKKIHIILLDQFIHFLWTEQFLIVLKKKNSKKPEKDNIHWKHQFKKRKRIDISWEITVSINYISAFCS